MQSVGLGVHCVRWISVGPLGGRGGDELRQRSCTGFGRTCRRRQRWLRKRRASVLGHDGTESAVVLDPLGFSHGDSVVVEDGAARSGMNEASQHWREEDELVVNIKADLLVGGGGHEACGEARSVSLGEEEETNQSSSRVP